MMNAGIDPDERLFNDKSHIPSLIIDYGPAGHNHGSQFDG
jgi:hypothetical protein